MRLIAALFLWFVCLSDSFKAPPFLSRKVPPLTRVIRAQPFLSRYAPPLTRAKTLEIVTLRKHKEERRRISPLLVVNGDGETKSDERSSPSSMWPAAVLAISLLLPTVQPASAAYGPSGAAVISPGVVKPINEETYLRLSPKKQRQYENGFLSCFRDDGKICKPTSLVDSLLQQLQNRGETVEEKTETPLIPSDEQIRLEERQKVLRKLGKQPAWVSYVAAAAGSCISTLVMHPLDTLKTRLMSSGGGGIIEGDEDDENSGGGIGSTDEDNGAPLPDVAGLYEGVLPNLFKEAPASAFYLGIYEVARVSLSQYSYFQDHPIVSYLLAGACGELFGSIIRAPAEAVKTRVQTGSGLGEAVSCVVGVERANTIKAWTSSLFRDVPAGAIQIAVFEFTKTFIVDSPTLDFDVNTLLSEALIGGLGGGIGALITTPSDVVTTTIIASSQSEGGGTDKSPAEIVQLIVANEGIGGLFKGCVERTSYWALAVGIFLSCYCSARQFALGMF